MIVPASLASSAQHRRAALQARESGEVYPSRSNGTTDSHDGRSWGFVLAGDGVLHLAWLRPRLAVSDAFSSGTDEVAISPKLARAAFERGPRPRFEDLPEPLARRCQNEARADTSKFREACDDRLHTPVEAGVAGTFAAGEPTPRKPSQA